jgi:hypothetical protein
VNGRFIFADIDECRVKNGGCREICKNTQGAFYCDCPAGLRLSENLRSCQDINECHLRNGHGPCQDTCTNTYGSYICDCSHLNGTRLSTDNHSCEDIDECNEASPGCSHQCINTQVGAFCSCPEGMELMSDYKTCQGAVNFFYFAYLYLIFLQTLMNVKTSPSKRPVHVDV